MLFSLRASWKGTQKRGICINDKENLSIKENFYGRLDAFIGSSLLHILWESGTFICFQTEQQDLVLRRGKKTVKIPSLNALWVSFWSSMGVDVCLYGINISGILSTNCSDEWINDGWQSFIPEWLLLINLINEWCFGFAFSISNADFQFHKRNETMIVYFGDWIK